MINICACSQKWWQGFESFRVWVSAVVSAWFRVRISAFYKPSPVHVLPNPVHILQYASFHPEYQLGILLGGWVWTRSQLLSDEHIYFTTLKFHTASQKTCDHSPVQALLAHSRGEGKRVRSSTHHNLAQSNCSSILFFTQTHYFFEWNDYFSLTPSLCPPQSSLCMIPVRDESKCWGEHSESS